MTDTGASPRAAQTAAQDGPSRASMGLASLFEQVARRTYDVPPPYGLKPAQWPALRFFARAGGEARTVTRLASYLNVTLGPASRAASALERRGLLSSRRNPEDGRSFLFDLTDRGWAALDQDPLQRLATEIDALPDSARTALTDMLPHLAERLSRKDG